MKCPNCNSTVHYVQTTRHDNLNHSIKRTRVCKECNFHWKTEEIFVSSKPSINLGKNKYSNNFKGSVSYFDTVKVYKKSFLFYLLFIVYKLSTNETSD